ncbi:unnamed protein product [Adineta ricciae]|uniref:Uncharacterized protein n=1 Tax=Adineta ricciae TaxID=249248 RepID=A0A815S509_ADIRI|nr:unnamed protein product [Adineta ricciae]
MEDRDGKKPFIIPKTHTSNKDVVISEKPDSRNVTELFEDIKSYALEAHFDFRQKDCKSCDTIRNQKLQKLYNEKRLKMKKEQDPIERLAFHLVTYRDVATNIASDGLNCGQLSFPIEKYLGNPKDGIHLSKRPDVVLTSSGAQGLYRFGLLVCKVLLGKGYPTLPSIANNQLAAQVNYDHHYCKIQGINKEQRHIDDLLANSLIFCYEHENFEPVSRPPQILPIAILWYDLKDKFPPELTSIHLPKATLTQESQQRNGKSANGRVAIKTKTSKPTVSIPDKMSTSGTWNTPVPETSVTEHATTNPSDSSTITAAKYPSHLMVPYHRVYSTPAVVVTTSNEETSSNIPQIVQSSRDPRLTRAKRDRSSLSSDTNPLSPQSAQIERSLSENSSTTKSLSDELVLITKSTSLIYIPLNSSSPLLDPRLKTLKSTRSVFFLEPQTVKHALQQQKRLNHYHDSKSGLPPRTSYSPVPYLVREVSNEEYERLINESNSSCKLNKHSNGVDYSALHISVFDCFNFGLVQPSATGSMCVDLERKENKVAYEQIEMCNELIQREKQLNSQQIRLRLRDKRQRRIQQHLDEKKNLERHSSKSTSLSPSLSANSKSYIATGRKLLKDHQISSTSSTRQFSPDLFDFFSQEYRTETRSHVKQLIAELVGIFIEKYRTNPDVTKINDHLPEESDVDNRMINSVIDMDVDSPSSQGLCDHDERFRVPTPPPPPLPPPLALPPLPPTIEAVLNPSMLSIRLAPTLASEPNKMFDNSNYNSRCDKLFEEIRQHRKKETISTNLLIPAKTEATLLSEEVVINKCVAQFEFSTSESSSLDDNQCPNEDEGVRDEENTLLSSLHDPTTAIDEDSNRFRDEFVKLLTKEAYISKSSSPTKDQSESKYLHEHTPQRRRSHDESDDKFRKDGFLNHSNSLNNANRYVQSSEKKVSSTRTVTLVSNRTAILSENHSASKPLESPLEINKHVEEKPANKRIKIDSIASPVTPTDEIDDQQVVDSNSISSKSSITVSIVNNDHDYRRDLNEKRRATSTMKSSRSCSRSRSRSNDRHRSHYSQRHRSPSHNSSNRTLKISSESTTSLRNHSPLSSSSSSSRSSSHDNRHRLQQKPNRIEHHSERKRSFDLTSRPHQHSTSLSTERHDKFDDASYRKTLSNIYRQRNVDDTIQPHNSHSVSQQQPVGHRRFNYNHQSVANHPRFANISPLSSTPSIKYDYAKSSSDHHRRRSPASVSMIDRNVTSFHKEPNHLDQIEQKKDFYTDRFDLKPSQTIECLQMLLQKKTTN